MCHGRMCISLQPLPQGRAAGAWSLRASTCAFNHLATPSQLDEKMIFSLFIGAFSWLDRLSPCNFHTRSLLEGLGRVLHHLPGILVKHRIVLHDQEAVVVLLLDGHELKDCEGAAHLQFREVAIQSAEDAGVVATDGGEIKASCPKLK
jgi:hypothetical protein